MAHVTVQTRPEAGLSIQEAASRLGVTVHTLRYYERAGLVPPVGRSAGGRRVYSPEDLGWAAFVRKLRRAGLSIGSIRLYARLQRDGADSLPARVALLREHRDAIWAQQEELAATLEYLEEKLAHYEGVLAGRIEDCGP